MEVYRKLYKISILGCGWYGFEFAKTLIKLGHEVKGSTTSHNKIAALSSENIKPYLIHITEDKLPFDSDFFDAEILFITLPPKKATHQQHTFLQKIKQIRDLAILHKIDHLFFISSTSVYGDHNTKVDEFTITDPVTDSGKSIASAEQILKECSAFTTTIIRFGGLIGPDRHPGRFFIGKKNIPNGKAPINLIHLNDCIMISVKIIDKKAFGYTFNACCPHHPQKQDFYKQAAINEGNPVPEFINELKNWKIVTSFHVLKILEYSYQIENWNEWLGITENNN